jgi:hypothetical protein
MRLTDSTGQAHDVQEGRPQGRAATPYTKIGASEQVFAESEMRRQGHRWEVMTAPDGREEEEVTGALSYQDARRRLTDWRRERARRLLAGGAALGVSPRAAKELARRHRRRQRAPQCDALPASSVNTQSTAPGCVPTRGAGGPQFP